MCASVSSPLIKANIDEYYISSFHTGYCFIPAEKLDLAKDLFSKQQSIIVCTSEPANTSLNENNDIFVMTDTETTNGTDNTSQNDHENSVEFSQNYLNNLTLNTVKTNN